MRSFGVFRVQKSIPYVLGKNMQSSALVLYATPARDLSVSKTRTLVLVNTRAVLLSPFLVQANQWRALDRASYPCQRQGY